MCKASKNFIIMFADLSDLSGEALMTAKAEKIGKIESCLKENDKIKKRLLNGLYGQFSDNTIKEIKNVVKNALIEEDKSVKLEMTLNAKNNVLNKILYDLIEYKETPLYRTERNMPLDFYDSRSTENEVVLSWKNQKNAPWGLSTLSNTKEKYKYITNGGENVTVYIVDTGININHEEFEGRASWGYNAIEGTPDKDENGHGTHCAGIVGGKNSGVAKKVSLVSVKVLDEKGEGMISNIVEGIDFIIKESNKITERKDIMEVDYDVRELVKRMKEKNRNKTVVNLSIGGLKSEILNFTIKYATMQHGIHFVSAAGNENDNACEYSPASSKFVLTVAACDSNYKIAEFSNNGSCVDIYAPGVNISSAWKDGKTKIVSGTSMASPHVAGVMAIYLGLCDFEPKELKNRIIIDGIYKSIESNIFWWSNSRIPVVSLENLYYRLKKGYKAF